MALNPSGPISLGGTTAGQSIAIENGGPGTATISLNDAPVRSLAGVPSGTIIMPTDFYGKSNSVTINLVISGNTQNYDIYANRGPTYVPGISNLTVTVNPGVFVGSSSTGAYAMLVPSAFSPADNVTIINNGTVLGAGAGGGAGVPGNSPGGAAGGTGGTGGNAIYVNRPTTITNNGAIYSGGGGGGGSAGINASGGPIKAPVTVLNGGGGGGGGGGFNAGGGGGGGAAGTGGGTGNPGASGGTLTGGGGGLAATNGWTGARPQGGSGGGVGAGGAAATSGAGAPNIGTNGGGGGTGFYLVGNPFVTWPAFGTRAGNVS